jgi:hypothetical protein
MMDQDMHPAASRIYALYLKCGTSRRTHGWACLTLKQTGGQSRPIYTDGDVMISIFSGCNVMMSAIQSADG